jgi:hypothetical protein
VLERESYKNMELSIARTFACTKRSELLPDQLVMIAYVENRKNIRMHTGRIEKVWRYPTHYEAKVAFMPKNEVCFETLYLTDFNNWESPNAWSIVKSSSETARPHQRWGVMVYMFFFLVVIAVMVGLVWKHDVIIDFINFVVL